MKKQLTITTAMATALAGLSACSSPKDDWDSDVYAQTDTQVCVDKEGNRVNDELCTQNNAYNSGHRAGSGVGTAFLWYYLGRNSRVPYYGESIRDSRYAGGSFTPRSGTFYSFAPEASRTTRSQAVSRGGLGSSSRRFGGGWS